MRGAAARLLARLHADDHRLLLRWVLADHPQPAARRMWIAVTHLGSAGVTIGAALLVPVLLAPAHPAAWLPAASLTVSFLLAQAIKRLVQRDRPACAPVIPCPDHFSFPSGHATSSMAIALSLGTILPGGSLALLALGALVGCSRVVLGVHYPGDVLAGQLIATITVALLSSPS